MISIRHIKYGIKAVSTSASKIRLLNGKAYESQKAWLFNFLLSMHILKSNLPSFFLHGTPFDDHGECDTSCQKLLKMVANFIELSCYSCRSRYLNGLPSFKSIRW